MKIGNIQDSAKKTQHDLSVEHILSLPICGPIPPGLDYSICALSEKITQRNIDTH